MMQSVESELAVLRSIYEDCDIHVEDEAYGLYIVCVTFKQPYLKVRLRFPPTYPHDKLECSIESVTKAKAAAVDATVAEGIERHFLAYPDTEHAMVAIQAALDACTGPAWAGARGDDDIRAGGTEPGETGQHALSNAVSHAGAQPPLYKRVWVWFHHIMSPVKRSNIVDWARELDLWGMCKVGFPGALYVAGPGHAVGEYLARLKGLQWQAMVIRDEEKASEEDVQRQASSQVPSWAGVQLVEDMAQLAALQRALGLEPQFKRAILRL